MFTTVLDQLNLRLVDEDEEVQEITDRAYREHRGTKETVAMADEILDIIHQYDPQLDFKYNKFHICLAKNDQPNNFINVMVLCFATTGCAQLPLKRRSNSERIMF